MNLAVGVSNELDCATIGRSGGNLSNSLCIFGSPYNLGI